MDTITNKNNTLLFYTTLQRFIKSFIGFSFFVLAFLAVLAIGEAILYTSTSLLFNNYFLDYDWISALLPATFLLSLVYALCTAPVELITNQLILSDDGFTRTTGMLFKKEVTIPYACIDTVESKQSPLQRLFRFSRIYFKSELLSASGSGVLSTNQAREVTNEIAHRAALAHIYRDEMKNIDSAARASV